MPGVITQAVTDSFKQQLTVADHDFTVTTGDVFKLSLLKIESALSGNWDSSSTVYASGDEPAVTPDGSGYTAGGATLTNVTPTIDTNKALINFTEGGDSDIVWTLVESTPTISLSTRGCIIYNTNSTTPNSVLAVWKFGSDLVPSGNGATLTITLPASGASTSLLRIA